MSALANIYLDRGMEVSGSDLAHSKVTAALEARGARVFTGHRPENVAGADLVVTSTAVAEDNPELAEARRAGLTVQHRSAAAADLMRGLRRVAIAGTHGKTTTTTLAACVMAPLDPLVLSGGRLPGSAFNSRAGAGKWAVIEADESDRSFLTILPEIGVVTNIEADHLDHYRDLAEIRHAFEDFGSQVSGTLVACADDAGSRALLAVNPGTTLGYGFGGGEVRGSDYRPREGGSTFQVHSPWGSGEVSLAVPGKHNARNALAAACVGFLAGLDLVAVSAGLSSATLPGRRLELVAEVNGARVYDDYAHHPTEVAATLHAARESCSGHLVCAFQPHRYSRLAGLMEEFAGCFPEADQVILVPVYAAGEEPMPGVDSHALAEAVSRIDAGRPVTVLDSLDELPGVLRATLEPGDVAVCMGAGDIYRASTSLAGAA
jgi:UDP-N-acetylmuramate--alanine ligase